MDRVCHVTVRLLRRTIGDGDDLHRRHRLLPLRRIGAPRRRERDDVASGGNVDDFVAAISLRLCLSRQAIALTGGVDAYALDRIAPGCVGDDPSDDAGADLREARCVRGWRWWWSVTRVFVGRMERCWRLLLRRAGVAAAGECRARDDSRPREPARDEYSRRRSRPERGAAERAERGFDRDVSLTAFARLHAHATESTGSLTRIRSNSRSRRAAPPASLARPTARRPGTRDGSRSHCCRA